LAPFVFPPQRQDRGIPALIMNFVHRGIPPRVGRRFSRSCSLIHAAVPTPRICCAPVVGTAERKPVVPTFALAFAVRVGDRGPPPRRSFLAPPDRCHHIFFSQVRAVIRVKVFQHSVVTCHNFRLLGWAETPWSFAVIPRGWEIPGAHISRRIHRPRSRSSSIRISFHHRGRRHNRACQVTGAPRLELLHMSSERNTPGTGSTLCSAPFGRKLRRAHSSIRQQEFLPGCTTVIRGAVSRSAVRASAFPASKSVCGARTNVACSA